MTSEKTVERSVDSLQRIYAIIIALAINEAIKRTFLKGGTSELEFHRTYLPEFIAFIFTAVPFVHGMNRHLDKTLTIIRKERRRNLFIILVIDFAVFLIESCVLFLLAVSIMREVFFFQFWMLLLAIDLAWAFATWPITKSVVWQWALVNVLAVVLSILVIYLFDSLELQIKLWLLMSIAVVRTILDYVLAWKFYFPPEEAGDVDVALPVGNEFGN